MKNYAKVGNRRGKPAYRISSSFRSKQIINTRKACLPVRQACACRGAKNKYGNH
jgi:hypothetical protein